jgi:hypothetical protein
VTSKTPFTQPIRKSDIAEWGGVWSGGVGFTGIVVVGFSVGLQPIKLTAGRAGEEKSMPTARTSGSANGSSIKGLALRVATARAAAAMVAEAPTLDARSQVSLFVRAMSQLLRHW